MNYGNFRNLQPLDDGQLRAIAPSIFATEPAECVSDRYEFIPTSTVVAQMRKQGFLPTFAAQSVTRIAENKDFTKHMIRFTRAVDLERFNATNLPRTVNGNAHHFYAKNESPTIAQITLVNAHDRTSVYALDPALWRLACSNGLMVASSTLAGIHVRHTGHVVDDVIEGSFTIIDEMPRVFDRVDEMRSLQLEQPHQLAFARAAAELRWGEQTPVDPARLLAPRRNDDNKPDLWHTFNNVQENMIKGGVRGRTRTNRRMTTRAVGGVTENVRLNRALWVLAEEMAKAMRKA